MSDSMDTGTLRAALPEGSAQQPQGRSEHAEKWANPLPYDYEELAQQGPEVPVNWESNARVYEFDMEQFGDVGPEFPELELQLFGPPAERGLNNTGISYDRITEIEVQQRGDVRIEPIKDFASAGLHPTMLKNVEMSGYRVPTPIQQYTLAAVRKGLDIVAIAQTGSGKTAAYLVPVLDKLMGKAKKLAAPRPNPASFVPGVSQPVRAEPLVIVVCPARELAVQIFNEARKFCYRTMLRPCVTYGGGPIRDQIEQLGKGCDILIATPGRLCDFIDRPHVLTLRRVRYMIIDEADEMLHDDWGQDLNTIMSGGEQEEGNVKYLLFSATFPKDLRDLARSHLAASHSQINVGRIGSTHGNILQRVVEVLPETKRTVLKEVIEALDPCRTIIFVNSKRAADELDDFLFNSGYPCTSMHSDRTQLEREGAMRAFRAGTSPILVATGVMARGIDVRNVNHVINYDLPSVDHGGIEEYVHRIGRTGRIGHRGIATSLYCADRDDGIGSVLVRTLLETDQEIPDFLQVFMPEGDDLENLKWETASNEEDRPAGAAGHGGESFDEGGDDAWGSGNADGDEDNGGTANNDDDGGWGKKNDDAGNKESAADGGDAWGAPAAAAAW
ncbi:hypothetical protein VD0002_g7139 [Verticillium dahliae]|uniref:RNA helicase n=2 Tax=Verticillium dahliae TaxID=27337 RepID=G2WVX7_VERDV|nr:ATP-dependent RNA helicase ded-1 [Verticillium dahliae VdLs.17]KAF3350268.1 Putative uncharacterized transporter ygaY [Verticillium dahliae VDG2]KAH6706048.1 ATP-dependent RNA helicase ded-1 [Verticillium dahliae]EGY19747.1 ATP-dependent RNA helicase ded-1 [Verticillium dahliae VdLs.17]PNH32961.1 hypothetical protein BJF96_g3756 [Verticillium dahliae]PNH38304.1 hypothetical protein VD0004_g8507 [Verticillium dahliae]